MAKKLITRKEVAELLGIGHNRLMDIIRYDKHLKFPSHHSKRNNFMLYDESVILKWKHSTNYALTGANRRKNDSRTITTKKPKVLDTTYLRYFLFGDTRGLQCH